MTENEKKIERHNDEMKNKFCPKFSTVDEFCVCRGEKCVNFVSAIITTNPTASDTEPKTETVVEPHCRLWTH